MDPIRRIASLGSQLSSSFANRAPHRDAAPFLYPICSPLFYAFGYFRGISGHWKGLPLDFPGFRAPAGISALFEHSQGTEIRKKDTQNAMRRFVGFVNHQADAFLLPGKFK